MNYCKYLLLHLMNISFKNVVSGSRHLSGLNNFPAMLNSLSTGAEDAGIDYTFGCLFKSLQAFVLESAYNVLKSTNAIMCLSATTSASGRKVLESTSKHLQALQKMCCAFKHKHSSACPMSVTGT